METGLGVWADLVMDAVEVGVLGAVLWQLFNLSHDMGAMLRVVRRMGRKTTDTITSTYLHQGEADRTGNRERNAAPLPARIEDLFIEQASWTKPASGKIMPLQSAKPSKRRSAK